MRKAKNRDGEVYGCLTIIKDVDRYITPGGVIMRKVLCKCICGTEKEILLSSLRRGDIISCGCYKRGKHLITHGMYDTRFYKIWIGMKSRCLDENREEYDKYGGRGIKVCDEWINFEKFRDDMLTSYESHVVEFGEKETTLDRINNNGDYHKNNCRWATMKQQSNNSRRNTILYFGGKRKTISQWANETGIKRTTISSRLSILGWSVEKTLSTIVNK